MSQEPEYGKAVEIEGYYERNTRWRHDDPTTGSVRVRFWEFVERRERVLFLGWRNLSNGDAPWEGMEIGYQYYPKEYLKAALVSPGPNRNPRYAKVATDQGGERKEGQ